MRLLPLLIVAISAGATATVLSNRITTLAEEVFPKLNEINAPKGVVTPEYNGGPQTFLILGSDRRVGAKDAYDRENPPHSDTILLVRFDPEQGQTSVLSIPRDLMVNITASNGEVYSQAKINAAYTIGNKLGATRGGMVLAAETIEHEVFPGLKLNGIVDVSFAGFMKVVDTLGCAYVNVDHRYFNENNGTPETDYSNVNLQPGYQKLCYENALGYVRYRHDDSDFVRVARQQDFLRDLREQISPINELGQIDTVAKEVGHAISTTFHGSKEELIELAKLIAFSQGKPLRQVKFQTTNDNFQQNKESFVLSTPELEQATLADFLHGDEKPSLPASQSSKHSAAPRLTPIARPLEWRIVTRRGPRTELVRRSQRSAENLDRQCRSRSCTQHCKRPWPNSSRCADTTSPTSRASCITPTWSCGARTSAATTTSRGPTG